MCFWHLSALPRLTTSACVLWCLDPSMCVICVVSCYMCCVVSCYMCCVVLCRVICVVSCCVCVLACAYVLCRVICVVLCRVICVVLCCVVLYVSCRVVYVFWPVRLGWWCGRAKVERILMYTKCIGRLLLGPTMPEAKISRAL